MSLDSALQRPKPKFEMPLPVAEKAVERPSGLSPELQREKEDLEEKMAEARFALEATSREIKELEDTIAQLEEKQGLSEVDKADLAEAKEQKTSYEADLRVVAGGLSKLFERKREIDEFVRTLQETPGEKLVEQVKKSKEAEKRAQETPAEKVGREYQEVTSQFEGAKQAIAEKIEEKKRLEIDLETARYETGRADFQERPLTEENHDKHEAAVARVTQLEQQIAAADTEIARQKEQVIDAERKSIALFAAPPLKGEKGEIPVRDILAEQVANAEKTKMVERFQTPEAGVAWIRSEFLPARMKETILPSRAELEAEYKKREEAAKRIGSRLSRQDFVDEVRKRAVEDQTVRGLMESAKKSVTDKSTGEFIWTQDSYFNKVLKAFMRADSYWEGDGDSQERERLLKQGQEVLIKDTHKQGNWVKWMKETAQTSEVKQAQGKVYAFAEAAQAIAAQEQALSEQKITRPDFEEQIAPIRQEQQFVEKSRQLQRELIDLRSRQERRQENALLAETETIDREVRDLKEEQRQLLAERTNGGNVVEARQRLESAKRRSDGLHKQIDRLETKKKEYLKTTVWSPDAVIPVELTRQQVLDGAYLSYLDAYEQQQQAALAKLGPEPKTLWKIGEEAARQWNEKKRVIDTALQYVEKLRNTFSEDRETYREKGEINPQEVGQLISNLQAADREVSIAQEDLERKQTAIDRQQEALQRIENELRTLEPKQKAAHAAARIKIEQTQKQEKDQLLTDRDPDGRIQAEIRKTNDHLPSDAQLEARIADTIAKGLQRVMEEEKNTVPAEKLPIGKRAQELYLDSEILRRAQQDTAASREQVKKFVSHVKDTIHRDYANRYSNPERSWAENQNNPAQLARDAFELLTRSQDQQGFYAQKNILEAWPQQR